MLSKLRKKMRQMYGVIIRRKVQFHSYENNLPSNNLPAFWGITTEKLCQRRQIFKIVAFWQLVFKAFFDWLWNINKEASWLYAELKSHILFQVSFFAYLKLSGETWNEMCYLKLFETFQTYHGGLLIWKFQMRLEMRCAIWNCWNLKLFNLSQELLIWNF